jgi:hypothetical protein
VAPSLAITKWQLGEIGPARPLTEEPVAHAIETDHVPTLVNTYMFKARVEMVRGDAGAARRDAEIDVKLSQENAITQFTAWGALPPLGQAFGWTAARPERQRFDGRWRRTPTKEANCMCRSSKIYLP